MLILPYSTALRLNQFPYITVTVMVLCVAIFIFQLNNQKTIINAAEEYCDSIQSNDSTSINEFRNKYDSMPKNKTYCVEVLLMMHYEYDLDDWKETYLELYLPDDENDDLLQYIPFDLKRYQNFLATGVPKDLDVRLMYYPFTFNPIKMLTSALAHADWSHLIFNLIFFFAFTPTLEILIGNKLKFITVLVSISLIGGVAYSIASILRESYIPTLGLSGVVSGMIGFSAFMMPHANIRTLIWFLFYVRRLFIPAWILAIWYIGWDVYDLFSRTSNGGTNFVAHVSGGLSGYLIARLWFKARRDDVQDELDDAIEVARAGRDGSFRGMMSLHMGDRTRIDSDYRECQAKKDWAAYKDRVFKQVRAGNSSAVMLIILEDYNNQFKSPETYQELFKEIGQWRKKRSYFCVGRLLINLYMDQGKLGNAFTVVNECMDADSNFLLPIPSTVLMLANVAVTKQQYKLAYKIITGYKRRYYDTGVCTEHLILEAKLLYQHLGRRDVAIALLEKGISSVGIYDAEKLRKMLELIKHK
jgi:membrane associated rhomboid family serine protease